MKKASLRREKLHQVSLAGKSAHRCELISQSAVLFVYAAAFCRSWHRTDCFSIRRLPGFFGPSPPPVSMSADRENATAQEVYLTT